MRYSPFSYDCYGLRCQHGVLTPLGDYAAILPFWNLAWLTTVHLDGFWQLDFNDLQTYKILHKQMPWEHIRKIKALFDSCKTHRHLTDPDTMRAAEWISTSLPLVRAERSILIARATEAAARIATERSGIFLNGVIQAEFYRRRQD